jgi:hypothetical protein
MPDPRPCPGCAKPLPENTLLAALSRFDNTTAICSDCGRREGLAQFAAQARGEDPRKVLAGPGRLADEEIA